MAVLSVAGIFLLLNVLRNMPNSFMQSAQALILKNKYGFDEASLGFAMSAQFAFGGFANGFLLAPVAKLLGGKEGDMLGFVTNGVAVSLICYVLQAYPGFHSKDEILREVHRIS